MGNNTSIVNLGSLSKPATVLIEKISAATGILYEPRRIRKKAQAESDADKIKALAQIEIDDIQRRALVRFVSEETKKQENLENITAEAISQLNEDATPQDIEDDWITNFFDKCKLISDKQMQSLWAKILASEANHPGSHSKRMIGLLSSMDKSDAVLFSNLCRYCWNIGTDTNITPLVYKIPDEIYTKNNIIFDSLRHLDSIGLISYEGPPGYVNTVSDEDVVKMVYCEQKICIKFSEKQHNEIPLGQVLLTKSGKELATIINPTPIPNFVDYVLKRLPKANNVIFSEWPKK